VSGAVNAILRPLDHPLGFAARFAATGLAAALLLALAYGSTALRPAASTGTACAALTLSLGRPGAAAGSVFYPLRFTNASPRSCTLYGWPGVSFIWRNGRQAGRAAIRDGGDPSAVTIAPGGTAHAVLQAADALAYPIAWCIPAVVFRLKVYPPASRTALLVPLTTVTCSRRMPLWLGDPLTVSAVTGGA